AGSTRVGTGGRWTGLKDQCALSTCPTWFELDEGVGSRPGARWPVARKATTTQIRNVQRPTSNFERSTLEVERWTLGRFIWSCGRLGARTAGPRVAKLWFARTSCPRSKSGLIESCDLLIRLRGTGE